MRCIALFVLLLLPFSTAFAEIEVPHIVIFGTAETAVVPDELRWSVLVKTEGQKVADVAKIHNAEASEVLHALKLLGLGKDKVETSNMQLSENWAYRSSSRVREGYFASTVFTFTTTDFANYVTFWTRLTELNNVTINSVDFALSNREEVENLTKIKAIKAGREKGARFAEALGSTIGEPLLIEELGDGGHGPQPVYRAAVVANSAGGADVISPGKEIVSSQVKIIFELEGKE